MRQLVTDFIPHAPQLGLYVAPSIPSDKLRNALRDYASMVSENDVIAVYDATLLGSAKDGAVFTSERLVFQNNDLEQIHDVKYDDIVDVVSKRKLIGGRRVLLKVNRGRATFNLEMDFSGKPDAAEYVVRFLKEAMLREPASVASSGHPISGHTDVDAVRSALDQLRERGVLTRVDMEAMLEVLVRSR